MNLNKNFLDLFKDDSSEKDSRTKEEVQRDLESLRKKLRDNPEAVQKAARIIEEMLADENKNKAA